MLGETARIDTALQRLDVVGIVAGGVASEHILDHLGHKMGLKRNAIRLPNARNARAGSELDEHEILPTKIRWRIAHNEGLMSVGFILPTP
jgi:hypothetical protein